MAVTRRMARLKAANLKQNKKSSKTNKIKECIVKLNRLTQAEISSAINTNLNNGLEQKPSQQTKVTKRDKTSTVVVKSVSMPSLWNTMKKNRTMPIINSIVLAKMKSYSPWPSKLIQIKGKNAYVYFFGTNNHGTVQFDEVVPFIEATSVIKLLPAIKINHYKKAVREAEVFQGIPPELSILHNVS